MTQSENQRVAARTELIRFGKTNLYFIAVNLGRLNFNVGIRGEIILKPDLGFFCQDEASHIVWLKPPDRAGTVSTIEVDGHIPCFASRAVSKKWPVLAR